MLSKSTKTKLIISLLFIFTGLFFGMTQVLSAKQPVPKPTKKTTIGQSIFVVPGGPWGEKIKISSFKIQVFGKTYGKRFRVTGFRYLQEASSSDKGNIRFYRRGKNRKEDKNFLIQTPDSLKTGKSTSWSYRLWSGTSFPVKKRVCATFVLDNRKFIDRERFWSCFKVPS